MKGDTLAIILVIIGAICLFSASIINHPIISAVLGFVAGCLILIHLGVRDDESG